MKELQKMNIIEEHKNGQRDLRGIDLLDHHSTKL